MMMSSHETFVNYTMPLGLHHLIGGDHYAPMPENARSRRDDWTATYYHQAAADGIGFDRTMRGTQAVAQYFPPVRDLFDNVETCPEKFLLWFHRCGWDHQLRSGKTLWNALCGPTTRGHATPRRWRRPGGRSTAVSTPGVTGRSPSGWRSRWRTPPSGGTTSCGTSRRSASGQSYPGNRRRASEDGGLAPRLPPAHRRAHARTGLADVSEIR
jgi:hypothetical protein